MCGRLFSTTKLVYLLTLLCCSTLAFPINTKLLIASVFSDSVLAAGHGSYNPVHHVKDAKAIGNVAASAAAGIYKSFGTGESSAKVLKYTNDNNGLGSYKFEYDTENNIHRLEEGNVRQIGNTRVITATGNYQYLGPNGEQVFVVYVADENGYRPHYKYSSRPRLGEPIPPAALGSLLGGTG